MKSGIKGKKLPNNTNNSNKNKDKKLNLCGHIAEEYMIRVNIVKYKKLSKYHV